MMVNAHCFSEPNPRVFDWAPGLSVAEAAVAMAMAFGFETGTFGLRDELDRTLDSGKTLTENGVRDGDDVFLVVL